MIYQMRLKLIRWTTINAETEELAGRFALHLQLMSDPHGGRSPHLENIRSTGVDRRFAL